MGEKPRKTEELTEEQKEEAKAWKGFADSLEGKTQEQETTQERDAETLRKQRHGKEAE